MKRPQLDCSGVSPLWGYDRRMRARRRPEQGNPAAALAIIATIFATALVIKLLSPATRQVPMPMAAGELPSRALPIWIANHESVSSAVIPLPAPRPRTPVVPAIADESAPAEATGTVTFTFDVDPGEAPALPAAAPVPLAVLPPAVAAVPAVDEISHSPLVSPFTRTESALRLAFAKAGSAIKTAASGTAAVFGSR